MRDWLIRAIKTFVQSFFGVVIPELCIILNGGFTDVQSLWLALAPTASAALSASICAIWNLYLESQKESNEK